MARTRIIIGFSGSKASPQRSLVYLGESGSEAEQAMKQCTSVERFEIFEGMGRRKANPRFVPGGIESASESSPESAGARRRRS